MTVTPIHRGHGWTAVWRSGTTLLRRLPGDTPELVEALHRLNAAGLLPPNCTTEGWPAGKCPRCGRQTAVQHWGDIPSVCTGCRAEWLAERTDFAEWNHAVYGRQGES